MLLAEVKMKT